MENSKKLFNSLPENEKLALIEKVMPCSGTHRQLEESGNLTDGQWDLLKDEFINSIDWEKGLELEEIDIHDKTYIVKGASKLGNNYEAIGYYSDGALLFIEDLELKK